METNELSFTLLGGLIIVAALMLWIREMLLDKELKKAAGVIESHGDQYDDGWDIEYNAGLRRGIERAAEVCKKHPPATAKQLLKTEADNITRSKRPYVSLAEDDGYYAGLKTIADVLGTVIEHEIAQKEMLAEASFLG